MGLDIAAYSNIEVVEYTNNRNEDFWDSIQNSDNLHSGYINHDFPHTLNVSDMPTGASDIIFSTTDDSEAISFHAGSYSGYNKFRETLCFGKYTPRDMWESKTMFNNNIPFADLINFSDCEGFFINREVMSRLAKQFTDNLEVYAAYVKKNSSWPEYHLGTYNNFTKAFTLGAHNGIVVFH